MVAIDSKLNVRTEAIKAMLMKKGIKSPFIIGEAVFIRTASFHLTGRIIAEIKNFLILEDAAWVADSGRFMQAIVDGNLNEVEPVPGPVRINTASIVDVFCWSHALPRSQK